MRSCLVAFFVCSFVLLTPSIALRGQSVEILEIGPSSSARSPNYYLINGPGTVAAAYRAADNPYYQIWEEGVGIRDLTFPAGSRESGGGMLRNGVSDDGTTFWANARTTNDLSPRVVRWHPGNPVGDILPAPANPSFPTCGVGSLAIADNDGSRAVGVYRSRIGNSCYWNGVLIMEGDGSVEYLPPTGQANDLWPLVIASDGSIVFEERDPSTGNLRYLILPPPPATQLVSHPVNAYLSGMTGWRVTFSAEPGTVFVWETNPNPDEIWRWREGIGPERLSPPTSNPDLIAVAANGKAAIGYENASSVIGTGLRCWYWSEASGFRDIAELVTELDPTFPQYLLFTADSISDDGNTIFGTALTVATPRLWVPMRVTFNFSAPDSDGDGLLDSWEEEGGGIDVDGDGVIDLSLWELGARPDRKDLFVEVDATRDYVLPPQSIQMLVHAFDQAPVNNPDGSTGITLHIDASETGIDAPEIVPREDEQWPPLFDTLKQAHFGTDEDRANPKRLEAKAKFVRYCLLFEKTAQKEGGLARQVHTGDFYVNLGYGRAAFPNDPFEYDYDAALLVMHELGHALGLGHGGGDEINGKPNYPSIMNYALTHVAPFSEEFHRLDYCRVQLPTLFESNIDETIGVGGDPEYSSFRMPVGFFQQSSAGGSARVVYTVPLDGSPVDVGAPGGNFPRDNQFTPGVGADLNWLTANPQLFLTLGMSPGEVLNGHNDWANLKYALPDPSRSRSTDPPVCGFDTLALREVLNSIPLRDPERVPSSTWYLF